ncbi:tyrosine-type recombinase/integrase [Enterococcus sp. N249-2]
MERVKPTLKEVFDNWLENSNSKNTKDSYKRIVPQFFSLTMNKDLQEVEEEDINNLTMMSVDKNYKEYILKELGYKKSTLINYLTIVSSFFKQLEIYETYDNVNYSLIINIFLSSSRIKNDQMHRKNMSFSDYEDFKQWLRSGNAFSDRYKSKGYQYSLVLEFMWVTAARIDATFNTKWSDIKYESDGLGQFGYTVFVHDKGDKINPQPISEEFYLLLKDELFQGDISDRIFKKLSLKGFSELTRLFCKNFDKDFTPHSIKRGAVTHLYNLTHDLVLAQRFAAHEDPKTTVRYINENPDRTTQGSYILSSSFDVDDINHLSKEELIDVIMSRKDLAFGVLQQSKVMNLL